MKLFLKIFPFYLLLSGCSTYMENKKAEEFVPIHQEISFAEKDDTIDGSIYDEKSSGFFASDRRANNIGDILTVTLNESLSASKSTTNTTTKADTFGVTLPPLFSNGAATKSAANQLDNKLGVGNGGVDSGDFTAGANQSFSGAGTAAQTNTLTGSMTVTVIRVYPNGNLEIKGQKKLRITEGTEYIRLSGIIRPEDISTTNSVSSAKIAEAQIEYVGAGILDSASKPGWGSKIFRAISPF